MAKHLFAVLVMVLAIQIVHGISCSNPASYVGRRLCDHWKGYCGECVSFVKVYSVFL